MRLFLPLFLTAAVASAALLRSQSSHQDDMRLLVEEALKADAQAEAPRKLVKPKVNFDLKPLEPYLPKCAWHILATAQTFPTTLPEWACIYQTSVIRNLTSTRHAKLTGTFPKGLRFFQIATYDTHGMAVDVMTDFMVKPSTGVNPYTRRETHLQIADDAETGTYEIYITLDGKVPGLGSKNQLAALKKPNATAIQACDAPDGRCSTVLIFRLYHVDDGYKPFDMSTYQDPNVAWGNVPPPKEFFGNDKDGWVETPNCDRNTQDMLTHSYSQMLRRELTKIKYDLPNNNAVKNVNNGFVVPSDDWEGLFANNDSVYLTATSYYEAPADGPYLLSEITGRMPLTPTGGLKRGPRFVDVADDYDVRYFGFSFKVSSYR